MTRIHHLLSPQKDFSSSEKAIIQNDILINTDQPEDQNRLKTDVDKRKIMLNITACFVCVSHSVVSDSLRPHGLKFTRLLWPWNCLGKNTGVGCNSLLQGSNPGLPHCRQILHHLSHQGSPNKLHMANQMQQQLMQYQQNPKDPLSSSYNLLLKCLLGGGVSGGRGWAESWWSCLTIYEHNHKTLWFPFLQVLIMSPSARNFSAAPNAWNCNLQKGVNHQRLEEFIH